MIAIAMAAAQTALGRFWWQIPLVIALCVGVLRWDHKRIAVKVEAGKAAVTQEVKSGNDKAVAASDEVRRRAQRPADGRVRKPEPQNRDPYSAD